MKKLSILTALIAMSLPALAYRYSSYDDDSSTTVYMIALIVVGILQIMLFFKIWIATDDIKKIKKTIVIDEDLSKSIKTLCLLGKKEEAIKLLDKELVKSVVSSIQTFYNEEYFNQALLNVKTKYEPVYEALEANMPENIKNLTFKEVEKLAAISI